MKNKSNIFWGAILIVVGLIFLGTTNDWFDFNISLRAVAKYWPLMIVLAGVAVLFNERRSIYNPVTALLIAFAIPMGIYNASTNAIDEFKDDVSEDFQFEWDDNNDESDYNSTDSIKTFSKLQSFSVPYENSVSEASLEIGGGAAEFHLEESDDKNIFEAKTELTGSKFKLEDERKGDKHEIVFSMKSRNEKSFKFGKNSNNDVFLKINKRPIWTIDLNIGAGDLQFDLSNYKVKKMDIKTGAANLNLKLGDKIADTKVNVESGVAKLKIKVPKDSGCEIDLEGALNAKDFEGFTKIKSGKWQTDNFQSAKNKISLNIESGLSAVTVERY